MPYTSRQVVEQVTNLNSTRTLRRWTERAINLCDAIFEYDHMNVGYKHTQVRFLAYTEEDIQKFQFIASNKAKLGLNNAIQQAFKNEQQLTLPRINERLTTTIQRVQKIVNSHNSRIHELEQQKIRFAQENYRLTQRLEKLEQALKSKGSLKNYWRERASP
ncbi:hypothetical protein IV487_14265 [Enterococcus saccharolyticus]|uniref:Mobilization protein n=1 Tax=Candidatus Enterococcus willemsii TaxID=1857215 RepID=A0ABQ6YVP1_9ENTE|nr:MULTISPECIES: hypothetical protein [Enterococcus]KAF1301213.1 hypothetical protein BAU17_02780 [Enterococcus sp. CU12B]MCD5003627.1 hypothetical protein [Enterococcus saccharolyticus]